MAALNGGHHTLIQALLSRGPLCADEFHKIFVGVTGKDPSVNELLFNEYLHRINKELSSIQFDLRACRNQYDGKVYYGVVNTVSDEQSKLGTKYTVPQVTFYKGIIEAIVHDPVGQGCVPNIKALNTNLESQVMSEIQSQSQAVPSAFKNFSLSHKEKTLEELIRDQWLCAAPNGNIGLGVRSFLDLRSWFRNNEVPACEICNEALVKAEMCPNDGCTIRIHKYCLVKKFYQKKVSKACPGCGEAWQFSVSEAEAMEYNEGLNGGVRSQPPGEPSQRKRRRVSVANDAANVEAGPSRAPVSTNMRKSTRRSGTRESSPVLDEPKSTQILSGSSQRKRHRAPSTESGRSSPDPTNFRRSTRTRL